MHLHVLLLFFSRLLLLAQPTLGKNITANVTNVTSNSFLGTKQPSCIPICRNLNVPYPFGIGADCSFDSHFHINCTTDSEPFLGGLKVLSISPTQVRVQNVVAFGCYDQVGNVISSFEASAWLSLSWPYTFSDTANKLMVVGCDDFGTIGGLSQDLGILLTGCGSTCSDSTDRIDANCNGVGCCQTDVPQGLKEYNVSLFSFSNHAQVWSYDKCGYAFVGAQDSFHFHKLSDFLDPTFMNRVPIVVDMRLETRVVLKPKTQLHICATRIILCVLIIRIVALEDIFAVAKMITRAILISVLDAEILTNAKIPTLMTVMEMQLAPILQEVLIVLVILITLGMDVCALIRPHKSQRSSYL